MPNDKVPLWQEKVVSQIADVLASAIVDAEHQTLVLFCELPLRYQRTLEDHYGEDQSKIIFGLVLEAAARINMYLPGYSIERRTEPILVELPTLVEIPSIEK